MFNSHLFCFVSVYQILFEGKTAVGVEFEYKGKQLKVQANKEIFLTAGTIGTPKLLLLSGVGPRKHLTDLKVCEDPERHLSCD